MTPSWATWLAPAPCLIGMALLSLAMDRHWAQALPRQALPAVARIGLRMAGVVGLAFALWLALDGWGASVGWVAWLGWLTVGAFAVALLLAYAPRVLPGLTLLGMALLVITVSVVFV